MAGQKQPRQYAADYLKAQSKDAQKAALEGCPVEWRELVKQHIINAKRVTK
jgi:hypothetical protein